MPHNHINLNNSITAVFRNSKCISQAYKTFCCLFDNFTVFQLLYPIFVHIADSQNCTSIFCSLTDRCFYIHGCGIGYSLFHFNILCPVCISTHGSAFCLQWTISHHAFSCYCIDFCISGTFRRNLWCPRSIFSLHYWIFQQLHYIVL